MKRNTIRKERVRPEMRLVTLNNRSRKGDYIYVKLPGKKGSYYKYHEETPYDLYTLHYTRRQDGRKENFTSYRKAHISYGQAEAKPTKKGETEWKEYQKYIQQLKKRGTLNENIRQGATSTNFDPNNMNKAKIQKAYEELLSPLVLDRELLGLVIDNASKMKHRFHFKTTVIGPEEKTGENKTLGSIDDYGKRDIEEYLYHYIMDHVHPAARGQVVDYTWAEMTSRHLGIAKQNVKQYSEGSIRKTDCVVTFMKGRA